MPALRMIRLLNSLETGTTTGTQLQTLLAETGRLGELTALLNLRSQTKRLASSATAMGAVAGSTTAMTAVAGSTTAMTAVAGSTTAMTAVAGSTTAMTAVAGSTTAMTAVAGSTTAMTAVAGSTTAMTAVAGSTTAMTAVAGSTTAMTAVAGSTTAMTAVAGSTTAMTAVAGSTTAMTAVAGSTTAMTAVAGSTTAMTAIGASPTATTAVLGSTTANPIIFNAPAGVGAFLNECRKRDGLSSDSTLAGIATLSLVAGSTTAMTAIGASPTATTAVLGSTTANPIIFNAPAGVGAFLNECRKRDGLSSDSTLAGIATLSLVAGSTTAMTAVAGSTTAMTAIGASPTATTAVLGSTTANPIIFNAPAGVGAFLNECRKRDGLSSDSTLAGIATLSLVAGSTTAMTALNASDTAMNALYASALIVKVNYGGTGSWYGDTTTRSGIGLFVRITSKGNQAGWGDGSTGNEYVSYDGVAVYQSTRNTNPYNHTSLTASPRLPMRRFASSLNVRGYNAMEIAYIPLTA